MLRYFFAVAIVGELCILYEMAMAKQHCTRMTETASINFQSYPFVSGHMMMMIVNLKCNCSSMLCWPAFFKWSRD
jgi:hypothetical protein